MEIKYKKLKVVATNSAMLELVKEGKNLFDVIQILTEGYNAPRKRKKDVIEKWFDKGKKTYNVVVVYDLQRYSNEDCWLLIHFGKFTKKK